MSIPPSLSAPVEIPVGCAGQRRFAGGGAALRVVSGKTACRRANRHADTDSSHQQLFHALVSADREWFLLLLPVPGKTDRQYWPIPGVVLDSVVRLGAGHDYHDRHDDQVAVDVVVDEAFSGAVSPLQCDSFPLRFDKPIKAVTNRKMTGCQRRRFGFYRETSKPFFTFKEAFFSLLSMLRHSFGLKPILSSERFLILQWLVVSVPSRFH